MAITSRFAGMPNVPVTRAAAPAGRIPAQDSYDHWNRLVGLQDIDRQLGGALSGNGGVMFPDPMVRAPGWDNSGAVRAMYDALRSKGKKIYGRTEGTLKDIYADLTAAYAPLEGNTRMRYDTAISTTGASKAAGDAEANMRASAEDAARRDMMARMGIGSEADTGSGGGNVDLARERGATNRDALQANWAGLMGSMSGAQQGRDASSLRGATDQQTMALEELATRWSDYQNDLAQRESQAMRGARGGGGMMLNPLYQGLAPLAQIARLQQFSNQTGVPVSQLSAIMNPEAANAMGADEQEFWFNSAADRAAAGAGGQREWDALQARQNNLGPGPWAARYLD